MCLQSNKGDSAANATYASEILGSEPGSLVDLESFSRGFASFILPARVLKELEAVYPPPAPAKHQPQPTSLSSVANETSAFSTSQMDMTADSDFPSVSVLSQSKLSDARSFECSTFYILKFVFTENGLLSLIQTQTAL